MCGASGPVVDVPVAAVGWMIGGTWLGFSEVVVSGSVSWFGRERVGRVLQCSGLEENGRSWSRALLVALGRGIVASHHWLHVGQREGRGRK